MTAHANTKSGPEDVSPSDWTYCLHKPERVMTTKPDR